MKTYYFIRREEAIRKFIKGLTLDVGCAEKRFADNAGVGIDIRKNENVDVLADAHYLPFRDSVFDTVIAGELIEHLLNPALFLLEAKRVLKTGGRLIITTPNALNITIFLKGLFGLRGLLDIPEHKYIWDIKLLTNLLNACGFSIKVAAYCGDSSNIFLGIIRRLIKQLCVYLFMVATKT